MVEGTNTHIFDREETNKDNEWVLCTETSFRTPQNLTHALKSHRGIPFASTVSPPCIQVGSDRGYRDSGKR